MGVWGYCLHEKHAHHCVYFYFFAGGVSGHVSRPYSEQTLTLILALFFPSIFFPAEYLDMHLVHFHICSLVFFL